MGSANNGQLGRYEIVKHLANGGMAQVLLAKATGIEGFARHVVVKRIHKERTGDPAFVKMFLDEARLAATLHHHNIVQVHDIGQEGGEYFFAMEYLHGEDLRHLLMEVSKRKQKVPFEHIVSIVMAAASALHYAHEMRGTDRKPLGLVHRDVSPANIIVGYDGNVKVVDFGIAKAAALRDSNTAGGMLKGKVSYMAPEQCAGKPIDRRSDVYALGVVLYELVTVRRLFKSDNDFLTMSAIVQGDVPFPSKHRPDVPPELEDIIFKALSVSPDRRFASADEMKRALDEFAAKTGLRTSTSALADYMKSLFGDKPEPWLSDEPTALELSIDFDGSASGIAEAPAASREQLKMPATITPMPDAPIVHARTKAITENPATRASALPPSAPRRSKAPSVMIPPKHATVVPLRATSAPAVATIPARPTPVAANAAKPAAPAAPVRPTPVPAAAAPSRSTPVATTTVPARPTPVPTTPMPPSRPTPMPAASASPPKPPPPRRNTPPATPGAGAAVATADKPTTPPPAITDGHQWSATEKSASVPIAWPTGTDARVSSEQPAVTAQDIDDDAATFIASGNALDDELAVAGLGAKAVIPAAGTTGKPVDATPTPDAKSASAAAPTVLGKLPRDEQLAAKPAAAHAIDLDLASDDEQRRDAEKTSSPSAARAAAAVAPARRTKLFVGVGLGAIAAAVLVMFVLSSGKKNVDDAKPFPAKTAPAPTRATSDDPITPPNLAKDIVTRDEAGSASAANGGGATNTAGANTTGTAGTTTGTAGTTTGGANAAGTNGANTAGTSGTTTDGANAAGTNGASTANTNAANTNAANTNAANTNAANTNAANTNAANTNAATTAATNAANTGGTNATGTNTGGINASGTNTTGANTVIGTKTTAGANTATGAKTGATTATGGKKKPIKRPTKTPTQDKGSWNPDQLFPE